MVDIKINALGKKTSQLVELIQPKYRPAQKKQTHKNKSNEELFWQKTN